MRPAPAATAPVVTEMANSRRLRTTLTSHSSARSPTLPPALPANRSPTHRVRLTTSKDPEIMTAPTMNPRITTVIRMPGSLWSSQAMTSHPLSLQLSSAWIDVAPTIPPVSLHLAPLSAAIEPIGHRAKVGCGGSVGRRSDQRRTLPIRMRDLGLSTTARDEDASAARHPPRRVSVVCHGPPPVGADSGNRAKPALA
jgi:hypothetical protein